LNRSGLNEELDLYGDLSGYRAQAALQERQAGVQELAMKYELSEHALIRMRERKIELAWLEQAITRPQRTEPDEDDPGMEHRLAAIAERDYRVLRVLCDPRANPLKIVTMHFDRSMKGKL
jgi:hypothetical protein